MVVHTENIDPCGVTFIESVSDQRLMIRCGDEYCEFARDPKGYEREWIETDIPWGQYVSQEEEYAEAGRILMGVE